MQGSTKHKSIRGDSGRLWAAGGALVARFVDSTPTLDSSISLFSTNAPWSDVLEIMQRSHDRRPWFEQSCRGYRIALRMSQPVRIDFKLLGERIRSDTFTPGDFCFLTPGTIERLRIEDPGEALLVAISPQFLESTSAEMAGGEGVEIPSAKRFRDGRIAQMILALRAEAANSFPGGRLYGESLATALAEHIVRRFARLPRTVREYHDGLSAGSLRRVADFIHEHLDEDLALQRLADLAHMSPYHFSRMFKRSTGLTPHRYLIEQRIERSKRLLLDPSLCLAEIAYAVGFPSQSHFTVTFSKIVGTTPGAYRKQA